MVKGMLALLLLLGIGVANAQQMSEVVQIMSRPAASLVGAIRPTLNEGGSVSAFHDKLILRGTAAELAAAKALIAELDRPAQRLLIEVRQASRLDLESRRFGYGVRTDDVRIGDVPRDADARIGYQHLHTRGQADATYRVRALDGRPALIMSGRAVPVYQGYQQFIGNSVYQGFNVAYRNADSGFVALPRVHGDEVTVEIYQQDVRPQFSNEFSQQQASTVLQGRIGDWLTLGSIGDSGGDTDNEIGLHASTRRSEDRELLLRVLKVD